jgi:hypothetical protein
MASKVGHGSTLLCSANKALTDHCDAADAWLSFREFRGDGAHERLRSPILRISSPPAPRPGDTATPRRAERVAKARALRN